jgi:hypothetical protein
MPKRIDELEKTWVAQKGTTVFNSYALMQVPYGRNRLYVSGRGGSGNCLEPGNIATYTGNSPASYNVGAASAYNPGFPAAYTGNNANYNAGNPASYNPGTAIPGSSGTTANYNPCATAYNTPAIVGYNPGTSGGAAYNAGNLAGYLAQNIAGYNTGTGAAYNSPTPGGYNTRNVAGYNSGSAVYTAGNPATYQGGTNNITSYTGNSAVYNAGNPATYNAGNAVTTNVFVPTNIFGGGTSIAVPTYNPGTAATYNSPLITWNAVLVQHYVDRENGYYDQTRYPGFGSSVSCPVGNNFYAREGPNASTGYSVITPANFPFFPGYLLSEDMFSVDFFAYSLNFSCGGTIPGTIASYSGNSQVYNPGTVATYNATSISGYNAGVAATYNTGTTASYAGNIIGGYTGNNANYNAGNPSGFTAGTINAYSGNNANYNNPVATYNVGNVSGFVGNNLVYAPGNAFTDCTGATISGYNPPGSAGNPAELYNTGTLGYNAGIQTYNAAGNQNFTNSVATYTGNNANFGGGGNPATYTGNTPNTSGGNEVYSPGSAATYNEGGPGNIFCVTYSAATPPSPGTEIPGNAVPGSEIPGNTVPGTEVPGNAVPGTEVPGNTIPGTEVPGNPPTGGNPVEGGGGGCCFSGDTLITMADHSTKTINTIEVGDQILSYNPDTQELETNEVSEIITRVNRVMFEYILENGITIRASDDHPFFVVGKGYASLNPDLTMQGYRSLSDVMTVEVGDSFVDKNGVAIRIDSIVPTNYPYIVYTFNNKYKSSPNFFANGVLTY